MPLQMIHRIRTATGERLLLMAVFGNAEMRSALDAELDRRALRIEAHVCPARSTGVPAAA